MIIATTTTNFNKKMAVVIGLSFLVVVLIELVSGTLGYSVGRSDGHRTGYTAGVSHGRAQQSHQDATRATRIAQTAKALGYSVGRRAVYREVQDRNSEAMAEHLVHSRTFIEENSQSLSNRELGKVDCEREEMHWAYDHLEEEGASPPDALVCHQ